MPVLIAFLLIFAALAHAQPTVDTTYGPLQGQNIEGVNRFLGIPFAAAPTGGLRFGPPKPPQPWTAPRSANQFPPPCPQQDGDTLSGSEDCLYLNVWAPENAANLPVLFFIHGGGNVQGSTSGDGPGRALYDGAALARRQQVIVVTTQYRLGALGFLVHPALDAGSPRQTSGNYGNLDQIAALEWTRDNIARFGGDPSRVLLFGESAGAVNTCALLASPLARGLFSAALMQSGSCLAAPHDRAATAGLEFAEKLGCHSAECLHNIGAEEIVRAQSTGVIGRDGAVRTSYGPSIDGWLLPAAPLEIIEQGRHNRVPFLIGANADETASMVLPLTEAAYRAAVASIFGPAIGARVLAQYPASQFDSPREALVAVTTDSQFVCPSRSIARTVAQSQSEPVYRYFFTHYPTAAATRGAFHGLELAYIFQHFNEDPADLLLQNTIAAYWANFAAAGNPNATTIPQWPQYIPSADTYLELTAPPKSGAGVRTEKCDFWDRLKQLLTP
ncbi:MAG: carboxylesterase family protein [Bryobacterales bacterium]|nr:carboxylesterase family protein [Bryobacterales bacterium]